MIAISEQELGNRLNHVSLYPLLVPNNHSQAGWPDRFIQLPGSKIIACELKVVSLVKDHWFNLTELRQTQAAWLAQWQRRGGMCFVLVGLNSGTNFVGYATVIQTKWNDWLQANCNKYNLNTSLVHWDIDAVIEWIDYTFVKESTDA